LICCGKRVRNPFRTENQPRGTQTRQLSSLQALTELRRGFLSGSLTIGSGSAAPAVDTRRREWKLPASALSTPFLAICRNVPSSFSTSHTSPESRQPAPDNHPISRFLTPSDPANSPTLGGSLPTPANSRPASRGPIWYRPTQPWSRLSIPEFERRRFGAQQYKLPYKWHLRNVSHSLRFCWKGRKP
jgi:hypothetical protein